MPNISNIDKNFSIKTNLTKENVKFYNVCEKPFSVYGVMLPGPDPDGFHRLPYHVAKNTSEGVEYLNLHTAGGRVRFSTNSNYIAIRAEMRAISIMPHFTHYGSAGFDLYREDGGKQHYIHSYGFPVGGGNIFESEFNVPGGEMKEYTLNMPLYSGIEKLYIVLEDTATAKEPRPYKYETPVVYYGSSITQGGCASRPGTSYQNTISRMLDTDYINLGFSGSAKAEETMAEYISTLNMSVFVYDYDHNAPDTKYLKETHERMFKTIRKAQPALPIVCVSTIGEMGGHAAERRQVIMETVENARKNGDTNVYFIDGQEFTKYMDIGDNFSVDGTHPNDLGFFAMANIIGDMLKKILEK